MRKPRAHNHKATSWLTSHVRLGLIVTYLITATGSFSGLVYITMRLDQTARTAGELSVEHRLADWQGSLSLAVQDYAHWTLAFDVISRRDADAIYEHLGSGAEEGDLFDGIIIATTSGQVTDQFGDLSSQVANDLLGLHTETGVLPQLAQTVPADYDVASGGLWVGGRFVLWSAAWVTPDEHEQIAPGDFPVFVGIKNLDETALTDLQRAASATDIHVLDHLPDPQLAYHELVSTEQDGLFLAWTPPRPGTDTRREILPWFVIGQALILALLAMIWRAFGKQAQRIEEALVLASTDELTGVPNRAALGWLLEAPDIEQARSSEQLAVLTVDLDEFKTVNDTLGHSAGDEVLRTAAQRLVAAVRRSDHVIRIGGDEFVCLVIDQDPAGAAAAATDRIRALFERPLTLRGSQTWVHASVGIAVADRNHSWEALLDASDKAMYQAKRQSRSHRSTVYSMLSADRSITV